MRPSAVASSEGHGRPSAGLLLDAIPGSKGMFGSARTRTATCALGAAAGIVVVFLALRFWLALTPALAEKYYDDPETRAQAHADHIRKGRAN